MYTLLKKIKSFKIIGKKEQIENCVSLGKTVAERCLKRRFKA